MTRKEQLLAMRGRDLIELCQKIGVRVSAHKNSLKEAKEGVVDRIIAAEMGKSLDDCAEKVFVVSTTTKSDNGFGELLDSFLAADSKHEFTQDEYDAIMDAIMSLPQERRTAFLERAGGMLNG